MSAPNASERKACWAARDELWRCLDDNNDQAAACDRFQKDMDANCPMQWVRHFAKRRDFLKYKAKMEKEGFMPADGPKVSS